MAHTNNKKDLTTLMNRAWAIHRQTTETMADSLKAAWDLNELADACRHGYVNIKYLKKDGTIRFATATLNVPFGETKYAEFKNTASPKVFTYWDVEKGAFRCFKVENLIAWIR